MKKLLVLAVFFTAVIFGPVTAFGDELSADEKQPDSVSEKDYLVTLDYDGKKDENCFYFNGSGDFFDFYGFSGTWKQLNLGILAIWKFEASSGDETWNMHGLQFLKTIRGRGSLTTVDGSFDVTAKGALAKDGECVTSM